MQFRRDALGASANLPISPVATGINGADTYQGGKLLAVESRGIVLESTWGNRGVFWIPYEVVLSVSFQNR